MKQKSPCTYKFYSPSPRSAKQIVQMDTKAIYAKNKRNSVQYVNLKPAKEKLETYFFLKMSTFVTETSFQFNELCSELLQQRFCTQNQTKWNLENCISVQQ